ncbi:MAG: hypothetical protein BGO32_02385 [Bacteroidetes bacterium 37-13]|nr:MAG: hypothetical protein BGO32_02385 [Bacteroidetes bacterium 37-13]
MSGGTPVSTRNYFLAEKWGIAGNGKGLGEVRDTANRKWREEPISSKKLFPFFKITKKLKNGKVFCGYFLKYF